MSRAGLASVRRTLRDCGAKVVFVSEEVAGTELDSARYLAALKDGADWPEKIESITDACLSVLAHVQQRLASTGIFDRRGIPALNELIAGVLADWVCLDRLGIDTLAVVNDHFEARRASLEAMLSPTDVSILMAHLKAGATRDFFIAALELISPVWPRDLLASAGLDMPNRQPAPTPAIVKFFHPVDRPIQYWTSETVGGTVAFVVYFSPACTYRVCLGCALPDLSSQARIRPYDMIEQTDYVFRQALSEDELDKVRTLVISNNGSVLDEPTFPQSVLLHAIQVAAAKMPRLRRISLETRAEFVTLEQLQSIARVIEMSGSDDLGFELALGVEVFDLDLRNKRMRKGLSNKAIASLAGLLGQTGGWLRCYMMLKSVPGMTDEDAIADIDNARTFFEALAEEHGLDVLLHINPTYAAIGTELERAFKTGAFVPPDLNKMVDYLRRSPTRKVQLHFGLNDEGLATKGGSFINDANAEALKLLQRFNAGGVI